LRKEAGAHDRISSFSVSSTRGGKQGDHPPGGEEKICYFSPGGHTTRGRDTHLYWGENTETTGGEGCSERDSPRAKSTRRPSEPKNSVSEHQRWRPPTKGRSFFPSCPNIKGGSFVGEKKGGLSYTQRHPERWEREL